MLNEEEFKSWCDDLNLSLQARKTIKIIRASEPSRKVNSQGRNVIGEYPSRKMGLTIQFESHKVELPFIYELEHDDEVIEFYEQPPSFNINYKLANDRNVGHPYTPDFFVIRKNSAGWVECKTEQELQKLSEKNPNRYFEAEDGHWHSPPGEQYAEPLGLFFQVWVDKSINWNLYNNILFLEDYYRSNKSLQLEEAKAADVLSIVLENPAISLAQLLSISKKASPDDIYLMIVREELYVDLTASRLSNSENSFVFKNRQVASAYSLLIASRSNNADYISPIINIERGMSVVWDEQVLTIDMVGKTEILLHTADGAPIELAISTFQSLVQQGKISAIRHQSSSTLSKEAMDCLLKASEKDIANANERLQLIQPYLDTLVPDTIPKARNIRNLKSKYRLAEQKYGYGYLGLISFNSSKGNYSRKIPSHILEIVRNFVKDEYENYKQQKKLEVYAKFVSFCSANGILDNDIPCYKTFRLEIKRRSGYEQVLKRGGKRAAYSLEPFSLFLKESTPPHGERPFHICHIDHTPLDIELRDSLTGKNLGKPWATFLVDAYSRRLLAVFITFDPPSYRSCMMVLRICVKRHGRLPQTIVVDNGKEFHSNYFLGLAGLFEFTLKYRPPSKARFNSIGERLFGVAMSQLVYSMAGNTQMTKKVREMTRSVNPKNLSLWTLGMFYLYLCEWAYEVYDTTEHPALGQSPREAFAAGMEHFGNRSHRVIPYDENFKFLTMPTTNRGKARVDRRLGVKINYIDYWSDAFRDPEIQGLDVDIRYEPFNSKIAYAKVRQHWVECTALIPALWGRSQKELQIASQEMRKRNQNHEKNYKVKARKLGDFLLTAQSEEILLEQRLRDNQAKGVFKIIDGAAPNLNPYKAPLSLNQAANNETNSGATELQLDSITPLNSNSPVDYRTLIQFENY